jgi:Tetratricopeptide repeat
MQTSKQTTTPKANPASYYNEQQIIKVWDHYIQNRNLKYYFDIAEEYCTLFQSAESMSLVKSAGLLLEANGNLFINQEGKSVSVSGAVDYISHVVRSGGYDGITHDIRTALEQIKLWNELNPHNKVVSHVIVFPYHITARHWGLGTLDLFFDSNGLITPISQIILYNPLPSCGGTKVSLVVAKAIQDIMREIFDRDDLQLINPDNVYVVQQNDKTSCGVISAEDGKDIIEGSPARARINKQYTPGAPELREQHLDEVNSNRFAEMQSLDEDFQNPQFIPPENFMDIAQALLEGLKISQNDILKLLIDARDSTERAQKIRDILAANKELFSNVEILSNRINLISMLFDDTGTELKFKEGTVDILNLIYDSLSVNENEDNGSPALPGVVREVAEHSKARDKEAEKRQDIVNLEEILTYITSYEKGEIDLKKTLLEISTRCSSRKEGVGIWHNDKDTEGYYIRNKYGYIQRNKKDKIKPKDGIKKSDPINKDGIYFEKLYHLKTVLGQHDFQSDFGTKESEIKEDLLNLKKKLAYILKQEKVLVGQDIQDELNSVQGDFEVSLTFLMELIEGFYESTILQRVKEELTSLGAIDFSVREDRYCLGRMLTVIGELANELIEGKEVKDTDEMLIAFHILDQIRSKLIHFHIKLVTGGKDKKETEQINQIIKHLIANLNAIIKQDATDEHKFLIDNQNEAGAKALLESVTKLLAFFKGQGIDLTTQQKVTEPVKVATKDEHTIQKDQLKNLIVQAYNAIKEVDKPKTEQTKKKPQKSPQEYLQGLDKNYQKFLNKLDAEDRKKYPNSLSLENRVSIESFAQEIKSVSEAKQQELQKEEQVQQEIKEKLTKQEQTNKTLYKLSKELDYLKAVEEMPIDTKKKGYVIQHIVSVLGQYIRDIEESDTSRVTSVISSKVSDEASISAKHARNQGLAHNIFALDKDKLAERVKNDILPAHEDFYAIFTVYNHKHGVGAVSFEALNRVGVALVRLGLYNEAIQYFLQAAHLIEEHPDMIAKEKLASSGITQDNVLVIDFSEVLLGIESFTFRVQKNLASAYLLAGDYKKAYETYKALLEKIDLNALADADEEFIEGVIQILNNAASCCIYQNHDTEALRLFESAINIAEKFACESLELRINMSHCYRRLSNPDKANSSLQEVLTTKDPIIKFNALNHHLGLLSDNPNKQFVIEEASKYIVILEQIFMENMGMFKTALSDKYLLSKIMILKSKIHIINEKSSLNQNAKTEIYNFQNLLQELTALEKESESVISQLKSALRFDGEVGRLYLALSSVFSGLINDHTADHQAELKKLRKAQEYRELAIKIVDTQQAEVIKVSDNIARAYSNYALWHVENLELRLKFLQKALLVQEKIGSDTSSTLLNIGIEFHNIAEQYMFGLRGYPQSFGKAYLHYAQAIQYLNQSNEVGNVQIDKERLFEVLKVLAMSYECAGYLKWNIHQMKQALRYYEKALQLEVEDVGKYQQECQKKISSIKKLFEMLQAQLIEFPTNNLSIDDIIGVDITVSKAEEYALPFYFKDKLQIKELTWEFKDDKCIIMIKGCLAFHQFKEKISQELVEFDQENDESFLSSLGWSQGNDEGIKQTNLGQSASKESPSLPKLIEKYFAIESKIVDQFSKLKLSTNCADATLEISILDLNKSDLKEYCKSQLGISETDLEFIDKKCFISLDKHSIATLRNKIQLQDQTVHYCNAIIYDNPILNEPDISNLLKVAKKHFGMMGVNQLIDLGENLQVYQKFQDSRKILGDEEAIIQCLKPDKKQFYETDLKTAIASDQLNLMKTGAFSTTDAKKLLNTKDFLILDAQGRKLIVVDQYTEKLQTQILHYYRTGELFETAKHALESGYKIVTASIESTTPKETFFNNVPRTLYHDDKLKNQEQWYYETGEILPTLQDALNTGLIVISDHYPTPSQEQIVQETTSNQALIFHHNQEAERPNFGIFDAKLTNQEQWYYETGEILPTFGAMVHLPNFVVNPTIYLFGLFIQEVDGTSKPTSDHSLILASFVTKIGYELMCDLYQNYVSYIFDEAV